MKRRKFLQARRRNRRGAWRCPRARSLAQQGSEFGSPELIAAAKKEGKLVYYTANFAEVEQQVINAFNKRFPEIKVEMVRAPGGQLITRIKTEVAAGKLSADVIDHSDRALMTPLVDLFQDYAPPNARRLQSRTRRSRRSCGRAPRWSGRSPTTPSWSKIRRRAGWI